MIYMDSPSLWYGGEKFIWPLPLFDSGSISRKCKPGPEKILLLEAIRDSGSLSQGARNIG
jgi:hypothetical protein